MTDRSIVSIISRGPTLAVIRRGRRWISHVWVRTEERVRRILADGDVLRAGNRLFGCGQPLSLAGGAEKQNKKSQRGKKSKVKYGSGASIPASGSTWTVAPGCVKLVKRSADKCPSSKNIPSRAEPARRTCSLCVSVTGITSDPSGRAGCSWSGFGWPLLSPALSCSL